jgi:hypothetical protein
VKVFYTPGGSWNEHGDWALGGGSRMRGKQLKD